MKSHKEMPLSDKEICPLAIGAICLYSSFSIYLLMLGFALRELWDKYFN